MSMAFDSKTCQFTAQKGRNACCWSMTTACSSSICARLCSQRTQACGWNVLPMGFRQASSPKFSDRSSSCSTSTCQDLTASIFVDACARTRRQRPRDSWSCRAHCQVSTSPRLDPQARMRGLRKGLRRRKSLGLCNYPRAWCAFELEASDGNVSSYHNLAMFALSKHIAILER
jgi:hypothetical protein